MGLNLVGMPASFERDLLEPSISVFNFHSGGKNKRVQEWERNQLKVTSQEYFQLYYSLKKKKKDIGEMIQM